VLVVFYSLSCSAHIEEVPARFPWSQDKIKISGDEAKELFNWLPIESFESPHCIEYDHSKVTDVEDEPDCATYHIVPNKTKDLRFGGNQTGLICKYSPVSLYSCVVSSEIWERNEGDTIAYFSERVSDEIGKKVGIGVFQSTSGVKFYCDELVSNRTYDCFFTYRSQL
jgi:hypothetical protein